MRQIMTQLPEGETIVAMTTVGDMVVVATTHRVLTMSPKMSVKLTQVQFHIDVEKDLPRG